MSKQKIYAGITNLNLTVIVYDNTSTTGAGLSGLTHTSSGLILEYRRASSSSWTQLGVGTGLVAGTLGSYTSGGIVASGGRAGRYQISIPDAAVAAGERMVEICLRGAANMHPVDIEIELDAVNYQDATAFGLSKFADIETDTQNIQSRLPAALSGGRMDSSVGAYQSGLVPSNFATMSIDASGRVLLQPTQTGVTIPNVTNVDVVDELGPDALNANELITDIGVVVWQQLTTATWPNDSFGKHVLIGSSTQRSVAVTGNHHVASVLHDAEPNSIPEDAFATGALSARVLAADAATEIATAVGTLQVLTRLDSMIESDGSGQFRFDVIALENAPSGGGGGGGTDWTSNERTAIRSILGFNSSGVISLPSEGVLDAIKDKTDLITSGTVYTALPVTSSGQITSPLVIGDDYLAANGRAFSWTVALPTGFVAATASCRFGMRFEDEQGVNSFIATGTVTDAGSGNVTLSFDVAKTVTGDLRPGWYDWSVEIVSASGVEVTRVKSGKNAEWQEKQT
jgi:hypothetical protein